ncbi:MAG: capsule biosynthesis protein CapA [Candidatus Nomurabacteria bacterium]|jgi:hypothetical protein|nr:capsule biosynthesis protein CapA [Candidatus Nomurabacteria bacterium]
MMKKILLIVLCVIAALMVWHFSLLSINDAGITAESPATPPVKTLTVGWTGNMVPSSDIGYNLTALNNVSPTLEQPDLMIGNLDGTLGHSTRPFQGDPSFADTLKAAGFDFITLVNNHSLDYGPTGLKNTEAELDRIGLPYIAPDKPTASITINGIRIGIMGLSSNAPDHTISDYHYIATTVAQLKKENDIVIVVFQGAENSTTAVPNTIEYQNGDNRGNVQGVAYTAINAGADLVLGDGPKVLRKVEWYNSKPIAYSLGNFVSGPGHLVTTGNLGLGGIFTATFENNIPQSTGFTSITLAKDGTPSLDTTDKAKQLLDSLSGTKK